MSIHNGHSAFENEVRQYFESQGFYTDQATYHEAMSQSVKDRLSCTDTPTSLYIRGRADRVAIHRSLPIVCQWETKTHDSQRYHDMVIELLPFLHHLKAGELGARCLYAYKNSYINMDHGFWTDDFPPVRQVFLTKRMPADLGGLVEPALAKYLPRVKIIRDYKPSFGSGDPFFIVDQKDVVKLPHWKTLIDEFATSYVAPSILQPSRQIPVTQPSFFSP